MRQSLLILGVAVLLAACSDSTSSPTDRLVILDDGAVVVVDSDGSDPTRLTTPDEGEFFQPVWSPDGTLIAFSRQSDDPAIYVARPEVGSLLSTKTDSFPYYFSWSSSNDLAMLRNGTTGVQLDRIAANGDTLGEVTPIDSGAPLFYSWNPAGEELAAHIGTDRLLTSTLNGSVDIGFDPGAFATPSWTERGILAIAAGDPFGTLVLVGAGGEGRPIATVNGPATFLANHDASLVALQSLPTDTGFASALLQQLPRLPSNRLVVVGTDTGIVETVSSEPVLAYFWSPVDDRLLVLDIVPGPLARWSIWADGELREVTRFTPDQSFVVQLLPFFDQYAQSVSLWASDGSAFAFTGTIGSESGVWVQQIDDEPALIHPGNWVSWAP